jgi:hypothetical protein
MAENKIFQEVGANCFFLLQWENTELLSLKNVLH